MGKILQGRYDRLLRRTTAQVGFGSKVGEALEDLFPTLDVENAPMELLRASGWFFGMGSIDRTAIAANTNNHALFNPPGSGKLVVLTSLIISSSANATLSWGPIFVALADASVAGAERDTRAGQIEATVALLQREDNAAGSAFGAARVLASSPLVMFDKNGLAVLAPGSGFQMRQSTVALNMQTAWMWRERDAEPEELNF